MLDRCSHPFLLACLALLLVAPPAVADDAARLLDHLGIERADMMGYSMGARITAFVGLQHPGRVRSCILSGLGSGLVGGKDDALAGRLSGKGVLLGLTAPTLVLRLLGPSGRLQTPVSWSAQVLGSMLEGNNIEIVHGTATLKAADTIEVDTGKKKPTTLSADNVLLATGSEPVEVKGLEFDGKHIVSSTEALAFDSVPKHLGIVGGGYIGLELGSVWNRLGSTVTVIEMLPAIAANLDGQVGRTLDRILKRQGLAFKLNTKVAEAKVARGKVKAVLVENGDAVEFGQVLFELE